MANSYLTKARPSKPSPEFPRLRVFDDLVQARPVGAIRLFTMKNYIAIILTLLVSTATAQQQKLPGNLYYLGDDLETTSVADKQTALVVVKNRTF